MTDDLHHLAGAYALDALSIDERRAFEAHYPTCAVCTEEVTEYRETAARLAGAAATAPPPDLKARLMAEIATTRQLSPIVADPVDELAARRSRRAVRPIVLAGAAAVVLAVFGLFAALRSGPNDPTIEEVVGADDAVVTVLDGGPGSLTVAWSPGSDRVALVGSDLAEPEPGMAYELWFVVDGGVVPAGLFTPTGGRIGQVIEVDDVTAQGWGITLEPDTGSDQPTSDILYSAEL